MSLRAKTVNLRVAAIKYGLLKARLTASATVEAAILIPIFIFSILSIISTILMVGTELEIREALVSSTRQAESLPYLISLKGGSYESINILTRARLKLGIKKSLSGRETVNKMIEGGVGGISISNLELVGRDYLIKLKVKYKLKLPISLITGNSVRVKQEVYTYAWVGDKGIYSYGNKNERMVYITPHGRVYHKDISCPYLKPKINSTTRFSLEKERNYKSEIYRPCESCSKYGLKYKNGNYTVYVSKYGDRFHLNDKCKKINHEIISIPFSHVGNRDLCSKEAGKKND